MKFNISVINQSFTMPTLCTTSLFYPSNIYYVSVFKTFLIRFANFEFLQLVSHGINPILNDRENDLIIFWAIKSGLAFFITNVMMGIDGQKVSCYTFPTYSV